MIFIKWFIFINKLKISASTHESLTVNLCRLPRKFLQQITLSHIQLPSVLLWKCRGLNGFLKARNTLTFPFHPQVDLHSDAGIVCYNNMSTSTHILRMLLILSRNCCTDIFNKFTGRILRNSLQKYLQNFKRY